MSRKEAEAIKSLTKSYNKFSYKRDKEKAEWGECRLFFDYKKTESE